MSFPAPIEVSLSAEEIETLNHLKTGDVFTFRGEEYIFALKRQKPTSWVMMTENATFEISEKDS